MSGHNQHFKPYRRDQQTDIPPEQCSACKRAYDPAGWPRTGWTLSGFSPWCPQCHALYSGDKPERRKRGPKPKALTVKDDRWTNLPH